MFSSDIPVFSKHLFNNYYGLEELMKGQEALSSIQTLAKNTNLIRVPSKAEPYFNRWQVVWIMCKYPFEVLISTFFSGLATVCKILNFQKATRLFSIFSTHMLRDWEQLSDQWRIKSTMLMPTFNHHQLDTWDIYMQNPIPVTFIEDQVVLPLTSKNVEFRKGVKKSMKMFFNKIEKGNPFQTVIKGFFSTSTLPNNLSKTEKNETTQEFIQLYLASEQKALDFLRDKYPTQETERAIQNLYLNLKRLNIHLEQNFNDINLFSEGGVCKGASLWFIYLYLKTKETFQDPLKHIMSVAEQFKKGIPRQASLLQAFHHDFDHFLKLNRTDLKQHLVSLLELNCNKSSAVEKITNLQPGIYRLGVLNHSLVYVKTSAHEGYMWDPIYGLFAMKNEELLDHILKYQHRSNNPYSHIYFHRYENLKKGSNI